MSALLNPYLMFPGNAREAMEFYRSVFGGELTFSTYGEFGADESPFADRIMHGQLSAPGGLTLMGSDLMPDMEHTPGNTVTISLSGDDTATLTGYWEKLSDGGTVSVPLEKQVWGDHFGSCQDRYGFHWMVNIAEG